MPATKANDEPTGDTAVSAVLSRPLLVFAVFGALMVAATMTLWGYYGTAVFFEMVRAGFIACF
ncbi:MAG: hypothetical protein Q8M26_05475 [Pseudolabrys sp.]|nr:hypothetical protein [Pseudolabrys sp.]